MTRFTKSRALLAGAVIIAAGAFLRGAFVGPRAPRLENGKAIRVEVLNGSGTSGAAMGLAEALRDSGFDVVDIRNADRSDYGRTLVLDRVGEERWARAVAGRLGVEEIARERNDDLLLEVTVIVGRDLSDRYGGKNR